MNLEHANRRLVTLAQPAAGQYYVAAEISRAVNNSARAEERILVPAGLVQVRR